jgi:hypothetical protein
MDVGPEQETRSAPVDTTIDRLDYYLCLTFVLFVGRVPTNSKAR